MRRTGHSEEETENAVRDLPDPIDTERYAVELVKRGMTMTNLTDRMGGSP